jgi:hypothetical protein
MLYSDEDDSFGSVYKHKYLLDCAHSRCFAKNWECTNGTHEGHYTPAGVNPLLYSVRFDAATRRWQTPVDIRVTQRVRPRFWFVALTRCGNFVSKVKSTVHFLNVESSAWSREFGMNIQGLNTVYLVYFLFYALLCGVVCFNLVKLAKDFGAIHALVKLFTAVIVTQSVSALLLLIHWGKFSNDGRGVPLLGHVGAIMSVFARLLFVLFLLFLSKGWTISKSRIDQKKWICLLLGIALALFVTLFIWQWSLLGASEVEVPEQIEIINIALGCVWLVFAVWFLWNVRQSFKREEDPDKKSLYKKLALIYSLWLLCFPIMIVSTLALDAWKRDKAVAAMEISFATAGYVLTLFLLWHSRADKYFAIKIADPTLVINPRYEQF